MQYDGSESFEDIFNHFLVVNYKGIMIYCSLPCIICTHGWLHLYVQSYRALSQGMANVPHAHYVMRNKAHGWQIEPQVCRYNNVTMSQYFRGLSDMARVCYEEKKVMQYGEKVTQKVPVLKWSVNNEASARTCM